MPEFQPNTALINKQLADRSHQGTSYDPETRARQEINEFGVWVQEVYDELKSYAKSEAQQAKLTEEIQRFQTGFAEKYNARLAAHGNCISTFITGASNFPTRRAEKANDTYERRYNEMVAFKDRAKAAILRELKRIKIDEAGGEIPLLMQKITNAEKYQEDMKKINAILRKNAPDEDKVKAMIEATGCKEETARKLLAPDFCGRVGFTYHLQNNLANIKRMKERLAQLQQKEATPTSDITFAGGRIVDNAELDRVQILYDAIPDEAIRSRLKGNGWRWSPREMAWQRKRTPQAMYDAKRITNCDEHTEIGASLSSS